MKNHWIVFFVHSQKPKWWMRFLERGFTHVFAVRYAPGSHSFTLLDWTRYGLDVVDMDGIDLHHLLTYAESQNATVVNYETPRIDFEVKRVRISVLNCVSVLLHAMRIDGKGIVTPYQFYNYLIKTGGKHNV